MTVRCRRVGARTPHGRDGHVSEVALVSSALAGADDAAELATLEDEPAAGALGRDHLGLCEQGLEERGPEDGVGGEELRVHTCAIDALAERADAADG